MADSIKHFTGFDITGKTEDEISELLKEWELKLMQPWGKEN